MDDSGRLLVPGEEVTIWPRIDRRAGMSYDTEGGAQPWKATYVGTTTEGKMVVRSEYGERTMGFEFLVPS